jgi:hypothetical protein
MMIGIIANIFTKLLYNFRDYFHLTLLYFEDIIFYFSYTISIILVHKSYNKLNKNMNINNEITSLASLLATILLLILLLYL